MEPRNLTRADVEAICDELEARMARRFLVGAGKGIFSILWKVAQLGVVALAGYGLAHWRS